MSSRTTVNPDGTINLRDIDKGLLKFCLEYGKLPEGTESSLEKRDPADYKWLREALESVEDDGKKMIRLVKELDEDKDAASAKICVILEELQAIIEDVENANDLMKIPNSLPLVFKMCAHTSPQVRSDACWILSTIASNNQSGQARLLASGALGTITKAASDAFPRAQSDDSEANALGKALTALGCLVRGTPAASHTPKDSYKVAVASVMEEKMPQKVRMRAAHALAQFSEVKGYADEFWGVEGLSDALAEIVCAPFVDCDVKNPDAGTLQLKERAGNALLAMIENCSKFDKARIEKYFEGLKSQFGIALRGGDVYRTYCDILKPIVFKFK